MKPASGLGLLLTMVLASASAGCSDAAPEAGRPSASSRTSAGTPLPDLQTVTAAGGRRFDLRDADWLQLAGGGVWTTQPGAIIRIDPATGRTSSRIPILGVVCTAMETGEGSLWAADCAGSRSRLLRIDPRRGRVEATIRLPRSAEPQAEGSVAVADGSAWVVATTPDLSQTLVTVDVGTNRVVAQRKVPIGVVGARAGLGGLWLTLPSDSSVLRVDPRTGKTLARVPAGFQARFFDVGAGGVWVQNNGDGTVTRIDPVTDEVVATIPVDTGAINGGDLAVGGGYVWARVGGSLVTQIDPADNRVVARIGMPEGSGSVAADDDLVWITAHDVDALYAVPVR